MKRFWIFCLTLSLPLSAAELPPLEKRVVEHTCANGIKVLILERHFSPTVSIRMMFRTGSVDEVSGKTGLAHMFEHMMFKGTKTIGTKDYAKEAPLLKEIDALHAQLDQERSKKDKADQHRMSDLLDKLRAVEQKVSTLVNENELWNIYEREGGSGLNASTSRDFTQYTVNLPSNKLELWAVLDSDRLKNPVFRQFYPEREVVKEERRMRVDTDPEGKLFERFLATAYVAHPYRNPTIGWESDLDHLSIADLEDFYRRYYTPAYLTIAIVGDVKAAEVIRMVDIYFGNWKGTALPRSTVTEEPGAAGPRRVIVRHEAQPHVIIGYQVPPYPDPDHPLFYAISYLLANGTTSRLYKNLVEKGKLASSIESAEDFPGERYGSQLLVAATPRHPHTNEEVIRAMEKEIEKLKTQPIADWELEKLRAAVDVNFLQTLQTNDGMASALVYNQTIFGDWRYMLRFQERLQRVTPSDIQATAKRIFTTNNQTIVELQPLNKK